jgi:hypothetical protein
MICFSLDYLLRSFPVARSRSVLGIEHPQEAMSGSLIVDGHVLCDPRAAVVEFGTRAAQ